jgi:hypothetical protein
LIRTWCMCLLMIRGWFMDIRWWRGRDGIRILESGLAGRISHLELALGSGGGAALDGDGATGDSTGITITRSITTTDTTRGAPRFITAAPTLVADLHMAAAVSIGAVGSIAPVVGAGLLMGTGMRLGDTLRRAARAERVREPSAGTTMADRLAAFRHAEARALVAGFTAAVEGSTAVAAGDGNPDYVAFRVDCGISKWRDALCSERS